MGIFYALVAEGVRWHGKERDDCDGHLYALVAEGVRWRGEQRDGGIGLLVPLLAGTPGKARLPSVLSGSPRPGRGRDPWRSPSIGTRPVLIA